MSQIHHSIRDGFSLKAHSNLLQLQQRSTILYLIFTFILSFHSVTSLSNWEPTAILRISRQQIASDCTLRDSVVINGTSPGPELRFKEGQRIWIRVFNDLEHDNTTIHWHGISQYGSPFADGTLASQYPIPPGSYFDYEFQLTETSPGTYMYHGHVGLDIITAYGALIVEELNPPPYQYDAELVLLFGDYFHAPDLEIATKLTSRPFQALTKPKSLLLNGNALEECHPNGTTVQCRAGCHHHVIEVEPSKTYRVRAIGITTLSFLYIAIEGHQNLSFIEVDGYYTEPVKSDHLQIHSGQRYSFLLRTKSLAELEASSKAKDRQNSFWGRMETRWRPERDNGTFILRYKLPDPTPPLPSLPSTDLCQTPPPKDVALLAPVPGEEVDWILDDLEPLSKTDLPPPASEVKRRIVISSQQSKTAGGGVEWLVNGVAHTDSNQLIPYLVTAYTKQTPLHPDYVTAAQNNGFDPKSSTFPIQYNETIELVILNRASLSAVTEAHPWHMHGQAPFYVASGLGKFTPATLKESIQKRKGKPYRRDTLVALTGRGATWRTPTSLLPAGTVSGWVLLRMKASTVGAFLVHCHIALHMMMGMVATLLIGVEHLPRLPDKMVQEYMTFDPNRTSIPSSYFDGLGSPHPPANTQVRRSHPLTLPRRQVRINQT